MDKCPKTHGKRLNYTKGVKIFSNLLKSIV